MAHRVKQYRCTHFHHALPGPFTYLADFTESQVYFALGRSVVIEADGLAISHAIALVREWNRIAKQQGRGALYSIPFVPSHKTNPEEAQ